MRFLWPAMTLLAAFLIAVAVPTGSAHASSPDSVVTFNEIMADPGGEGADGQWVEFHNQMSVDVDLSQWTLAGEVQFVFPEGTVIPGRGYLVVAASPSNNLAGLRGALGPFTGRLPRKGARIELRNNSHRLMDRIEYGVKEWPVVANGAGLSLAKVHPNSASGPPENWAASSKVRGTPGALNFAQGTPAPHALKSVAAPGHASHAVVINEIMYHHRPLSAAPGPDSPETWIELFNRGSNNVALAGWRLGGGIEFEFAKGASIAPDDYLIVAKDISSLRALYPQSSIVGPFKKQLSKRSDSIVLLNDRDEPVDRVHYFDGGRWPEAADGGGSSLELRDPWADNSLPEAWAASREGGKSVWTWFTNRAVARPGPHPATVYHEFVVGLLDAGEVLLDDIRVVESPEGAARPLLQNGTFTAGLAAWRILGNHQGSAVPDPDDPTNPVLRLVATGSAEHLHNHAETTLKSGGSYVPIVDGRTYEVVFRARWVSGCNLLNTRLWLNRVPKTFALEVPARNGTPGARNSCLEPNIGPTFAQFRHAPAVPQTGEAVLVTVAAQDPQGVQGCSLHWSANGGSWNRSEMKLASPNSYVGQIPGAGAGAVVQFFVRGVDQLGAIATFPARGPESRALYQVDDGRANLKLAHNMRLIMTPGDASALFAATNLLSNGRLGCTVVWDERDDYYDVGLRLKGSAHGRPLAHRVGFLVYFNADQLFGGIHKSVGIDRSGGLRFGQEEMLVKHIINRAGGLPGTYDDLIHVITPRSEHTGSAMLQLARYGDVFLDSQFERGGEGTVFEYELLYNLGATTGGPEGVKLPREDPFGIASVPLADLGEDKEAYRLNFIIKNRRAADDYGPLMAALKAIGLPPGPAFDTATAATLDVDEWLRAYALVALIGSGDHYAGDGIPHNFLLYTRPTDRKTMCFIWDTDFAFDWGRVPPTSPLTRNGDLRKFVQNPANLRRYYWHLLDILRTCGNARYLNRWASHYGAFCPGQDFSQGLEYLRQRERFILSQLPTNVSFAVTIPGGNDFTTSSDKIELAGQAPLDVHGIAVNGTNCAVTWSSPTAWSAKVPLNPGTNRFKVQGLNPAGARLSNEVQTITVIRRLARLREDY